MSCVLIILGDSRCLFGLCLLAHIHESQLYTCIKCHVRAGYFPKKSLVEALLNLLGSSQDDGTFAAHKDT